MKRVLIIQARTGSTRLPGKTLLDLAGSPMLSQQLRRLSRCRMVDEIVVATTQNHADDPIVDIAEAEGVRWFRGSEDNVLSRYLGAAREAMADIVVRVTSDCPLIDPEQTDRVIKELQDNTSKYDYASNMIERTFPRGLDTEALFMDTLERTARLAVSTAAHEHVTFFILRERPDLFIIHSVTDSHDNSDLRWTVDTPDDLAMIRKIYSNLKLDCSFLPYKEILKHVRKHPGIATINEHVEQKSC